MRGVPEDPYDILGVPTSATADEIKQAYRDLARKHHPDRNPGDPGAAERFKQIAAAFEVLGDPRRRATHDRDHRTVAGGLPETFVSTVRDAIDRAQTYLEESVLPHYAARWRGHGIEAAARLWRDLDDLREPAFLGGDRPSFLARRRAARLRRGIGVALDLRPSSTVSHRQRTLSGAWRITITPWILHQQGFADPVELDDAILRVLLQEYAVVLAAGRLAPPEDPDDWPLAIEAARRRDDVAQRGEQLRWAGYALLAAVVITLLYSGYAGW